MTGELGSVPDPAVCPTVSVEQAGEWLGLSRSCAYEAAARGQIPTLRFGRRLRVPVAQLRRMLGLDPDLEAEPDAGRVVPLRREAGR